jgi:hypothetical protein
VPFFYLSAFALYWSGDLVRYRRDPVTVTVTADVSLEETAPIASKVTKKRSTANGPPIISAPIRNLDNPKVTKSTKKRNEKDLPMELSLLDDTDQDKFGLA